MMTIVGVLLGSNALPWSPAIAAVFVGELIGDYISFWLGKYYKQPIVSHHWVSPYISWIQHGEAFIKQHGMFSILIGRFFGPMRSLIPMVAGLLNMSNIKFTIAIFPQHCYGP